MPGNTIGLHVASQMTGGARASLALEALKQSKPITALSHTYNVSRKFIHQQKTKAVNAVNRIFSEPINVLDDEKILFSIPVTKSWLKQTVVCLALHCRGSFRGIQKTILDLMDFPLSLGTIENYYSESIESSQKINNSENLSDINLGAHDEMFDNNDPILTGIDINSLYCYLASKESHRDADTWAIKLMELQDRNFDPERIIADDGQGLRAGHQVVFPGVPCDGDVFHMIKKLMEMRLFFRNRLKGSITDRVNLEEQIYKSPEKLNLLIEMIEREKIMRYLSCTIDTLVNWMQFDILEKAGSDIKERQILYDFVVTELMKLEEIQAHRIKEVRVALQNQRDQLLSFVSVLDKKFEEIAGTYTISINTVWAMCELLRCKIGGDKYAIRSLPLQDFLDGKYDAVEDAVIVALSETERTSCMIENLHSRIKPYCLSRKYTDQRFLDLLRFYLNYTPFLRSDKAERDGKSPAEILFKKPHKNWLEMLGYRRFIRPAL